MPYYFFIWVIMHLGFIVVAGAVAIYLFSDDITEAFREPTAECPRHWPSIFEVILKLAVAAIAGYISHEILMVEMLAIMLSIFLVPLTGLILAASIFNAFELDSIRFGRLLTLGDIVGAAAIIILGLMISSMDESMYMVKAGLVLAAIYLAIKLAMHYDSQPT